MERKDLLVLGAGSAGYAAALRAAELGLSVGLVDADLVGGTCLHRGCIPTKAWLHAAEVADTVRGASSFGIGATLGSVDVAGIQSYSAKVVGSLHKGLTGLLKGRGVDLVQGTGRLIRDEEGLALRVSGDGDDRELRASDVIVATGAAPITLGLPVDHERILTSASALKLDALPRTAVVLGGGVIGVEFASAWASLGVDVTIVEALDRLLPTEEPQVSQQLAKSLAKRGITVRLNARVGGASRDGDQVTTTLEGGDELVSDVLLVAVGRAPASGDLGLEDAGVRTERGFVVVDEFLATSVAGVHAAGDLVRGPQLAHRGYAHGIFLAERIAYLRGLAERPTPVVDHLIPRVVYCEPQVASVGLTSEQAAQQGEIETVDYRLAGNGKSQILTPPSEQTSGFVRLIRRVNGPIVGAHLIGRGVSELIAEAATVIGWEAFPDDLTAIVHPHPTLSEAFGEANLALAGKPLHMHA